MTKTTTITERSNMFTVKDLRQNGYKIRVCHIRSYGDFMRKLHRGILRNSPNTPRTPDPKGGLTRVEVRTPDGEELVGEALCSPKDQYNKKLGVQIALGRALKGK